MFNTNEENNKDNNKNQINQNKINIDVKQEEINKLKEIMQQYADSQGYKLNPNQEITNGILKGLLINKKLHGFQFCPCRRITGDISEDKKIICPCIYHHDEIKKMGHCHCGLFVSEEYAEKVKSNLTL